MTATSRAHTDTIAVLQDLMRRLRDPHASVKGLLAHLGSVEQRQEGAGYDIMPQDKQFQHLFLGLLSREWQTEEHEPAKEHEPAEQPYYVDITLRPEVRLNLANLTPVFGTWRHGTPSPEGNPFVIWFDHPDRHEPASPYTMQMSVFFSGPPEKAASYVTNLSFKREKRF